MITLLLEGEVVAPVPQEERPDGMVRKLVLLTTVPLEAVASMLGQLSLNLRFLLN